MIGPGSQVEDLTVEGAIGQGTNAAIWRVRQADGTPAALKLLHTTDPVAAQRLLEEGRVLAELRHPNVVRVLRPMTVEGRPGLLMELVEGTSLGRWLDAVGRPSVDDALELFKGMARGVQAAHERGLVHRDLNPGNVLLAFAGDKRVVPKIVDFGIVRALDRGERSRMTAAGPLGTPAYMAPEQQQDARNADLRSDVFSLGCLLYELLSGTQAFPGSMIEAWKASSSGSFPRLGKVAPEVPPEVERVVHRMLEADPDQRFPGVAAVLEELYLDDVPTTEEDGRGPLDAHPWSVSQVSTSAAAAAREMSPQPDRSIEADWRGTPSPVAVVAVVAIVALVVIGGLALLAM